MTDRELKHLSRAELIDIIYELQKQSEAAEEQNRALTAALSDREIRISNAGSIAEAAVGINKVFEAAQAAADQYLQSLKTANAGLAGKLSAAEQQSREIVDKAQRQAAGIIGEAEARARLTTDTARRKADGIVADAEKRARLVMDNANRQAAANWADFQKKANELIRAHAELRSLVGKADKP